MALTQSVGPKGRRSPEWGDVIIAAVVAGLLFAAMEMILVWAAMGTLMLGVRAAVGFTMPRFGNYRVCFAR